MFHCVPSLRLMVFEGADPLYLYLIPPCGSPLCPKSSSPSLRAAWIGDRPFATMYYILNLHQKQKQTTTTKKTQNDKSCRVIPRNNYCRERFMTSSHLQFSSKTIFVPEITSFSWYQSCIVKAMRFLELNPCFILSRWRKGLPFSVLAVCLWWCSFSTRLCMFGALLFLLFTCSQRRLAFHLRAIFKMVFASHLPFLCFLIPFWTWSYIESSCNSNKHVKCQALRKKGKARTFQLQRQQSKTFSLLNSWAQMYPLIEHTSYRSLFLDTLHQLLCKKASSFWYYSLKNFQIFATALKPYLLAVWQEISLTHLN